MSKITHWKDADVEIRSRFTRQRLWLAATIDVFLNKKMILSTGGELKFDGTCVGEFEYAGAQHQARLEWGKSGLNSFPCTLYIDEIEITQEAVAIENRTTNMIAMSVLAVFIFIACFILPLVVRMLTRSLNGY